MGGEDRIELVVICHPQFSWEFSAAGQIELPDW
jgi:hypothetical protein